jgi:hypothetical protein
VAGEVQAGSDADAAAFVEPSDLIAYGLTSKAMEVIARALRLDRDAPRPVRGG